MWDIQLFRLNYDHRETAAVTKVLESGWLTMGEQTKKFEKEFSQLLGQDVNCTAVSSCTASLHMALLALDIVPGDEIITSSLSFVADINMINLVGAKPVLADITSVKDWNVSVSTIKEKITDLTKAVIIVHYAGYPIKDIVEISELCKKRNIYLIEDVAHAPGASLNGKMCGTFGDIGCFSFFTNKNLSIGEGGMVSTLNTNLHQKLGYLRSHGMTTLTLDRHKGRAISYDVVNPGLNYRMDEIHASIGLVQLSKLLAANERRSVLTNRYRANLAETPIIIPFSDQPEKANSAYHLLPVLLPDGLARTKVIEALKDNGIQSSIHYPPFWSFTAYSKMFDPNETPFTSDICSRELTLPLFPTMKESEVDQVTAILSDLLV